MRSRHDCAVPVSGEWFDPLIDRVMRGDDPMDALAGLPPIGDSKEQWYCGALLMLLRARDDSDTDPGKFLQFLRELGYPLHDILHVAMLFESLLLALTVGSATGSVSEVTQDSELTEEAIQFEARQLISGVESYLKAH